MLVWDENELVFGHSTIMAHLLILGGATGSGKSSVAHAIARSLQNVRVVEVDDIKRGKYGNTVHCVESDDFPAAGRNAKAYLDQGYDTIVVEAFCDARNFDLLLGEVGHDLYSPDVTVVWLECTLRTSLDRKCSSEIPEPAIRDQHARYVKRYRTVGEHTLSTDDLTISQVVEQILDVLQKNRERD
jgi:shikimate kinase